MTNKFIFGVVSYDISPPDLDPQDPNSAHNDRRYANIPSDVVPNAENLKITLERALPFWEDQIAPAMLSGKRVLVVAHGNSLRALANTSSVFLMRKSWILKSQRVNR